MTGMMGDTFTVTSTDTATALAADKLIDDLSRPMVAATFVCETNSIRIAIGSTPTQAGLGILLTSGSQIKFSGVDTLIRLKYISAAGGSHGKLQIFPEYSRVVVSTS